MKAILNNRAWDSLSPSEQKRIMDICEEQENRDVMVVLDMYLKMSCSVLHDAFGWGEKRCYMYLGNFARIFRNARRDVRLGCQNENIDREMRKIFKKSGYPDEFFRSMFENWSIKTNQSEDK